MAVRIGKSDVIVKLEEEDAALLNNNPQSLKTNSNCLRVNGNNNSRYLR